MGLPLAVLDKGLRASALKAGVALRELGAKGQEKSQNPHTFNEPTFQSVRHQPCLMQLTQWVAPCYYKHGATGT
jgi:hypothetical protein